MYLQSKSIQGDKISSEISYSKGSVTIKASNININWNSYTKRDKVYNPETSLWTDTRLLYIEKFTRSIAVYIPKSIIKLLSMKKTVLCCKEVLQFTFLNILLNMKTKKKSSVALVFNITPCCILTFCPVAERPYRCGAGLYSYFNKNQNNRAIAQAHKRQKLLCKALAKVIIKTGVEEGLCFVLKGKYRLSCYCLHW